LKQYLIFLIELKGILTMGITDYSTNSRKEELATIPFVAHSIIVAKHRRREKWLTIALASSVVIGIITHFIR
jgi:hypothetical protein